MANFDNLVFIDHPSIPDSIMAKHKFDSGKVISVVAGIGLYSNSKAGVKAAATKPEDVTSFEVLVEGEDDVRGWQNRDDINRIMESYEMY
tara:strand:- start:1800 stop:2069 length:270 start_codon:yes stop_codon:yes gene_type:complete